MNYIILIIVGIAGIILGTYLGRRRAEKEGLIRQVGKTGRHVYYEKIDGSTELSTRQ